MYMQVHNLTTFSSLWVWQIIVMCFRIHWNQTTSPDEALLTVQLICIRLFFSFFEGVLLNKLVFCVNQLLQLRDRLFSSSDNNNTVKNHCYNEIVTSQCWEAQQKNTDTHFPLTCSHTLKHDGNNSGSVGTKTKPPKQGDKQSKLITV